MSESSALFQALLEFQKEVPTVKRDSVNPHFGNKYASLDQTTQTVTPLLCEHGLVWSTFPCRVDGEPSLRYRLVHPASGEFIEETMPLMLSKSDPQGQGSSLTYARRYAMSAVLGLSAEDDDGNKGSRQPPRQAPQSAVAAPAVDGLSQETFDAIKAAREEAGVPSDWFRMQLVAVGVDDVPERVSQATIRRLSQAQGRQLLSALNAAIDLRNETGLSPA